MSDATANDIKDDRLIAPPQNLSPTSHLIFWHKFITEDGFDGGVLEVSTNGGAIWVDVGAESFISGGYNGVISSEFESPIAGQPAWTGTSTSAPSMERVEVDLGAFAGNGVRVRWRLGLDNGVLIPGAGWWVDDIEFTNLCGAAGTPTPAPSGTPTVRRRLQRPLHLRPLLHLQSPRGNTYTYPDGNANSSSGLFKLSYSCAD